MITEDARQLNTQQWSRNVSCLCVAQSGERELALSAEVGEEREIPDLLRTFHARARGSGASAEAARVGRTPRDSGAAWSIAVSLRPSNQICCYHFTFLIYCSPRPTRSCRQLAVRVKMVQVTDGRAGTCSTDERSGIGLGGLHAARFRRTLDPR